MTTIICNGCRTVGTVNRVTAGLRCTCGSRDLDLYTPSPASFLEFMGAAHGPSTGWGKNMPDPLKGWNEFAGPEPHANPDYVGKPAGPTHCKNCDGSGRSLREVCRACGGTGKHIPPTAAEPAPQVAKHPGQTKVPFMGQRKKGGRPKADPNAPPTPAEVLRSTAPGFGDQGQRPPRKPGGDPYAEAEARYPGADSYSPHVRSREPKDYSDEALAKAAPYPMHGADCPSCGHEPTHLVKDHREDAWWKCPSCGPLANIDKNPEINPYDEHKDFEPHSGFQARGSKGGKKTGRALAMIASVANTNPGLHQREVLGLVLQTLKRYAE